MDLPKKTIGIRLPGRRRGRQKEKAQAKKGSKRAKEKPAGKIIELDDDKIFEPTLANHRRKGKVINDLRKSARPPMLSIWRATPIARGSHIGASRHGPIQAFQIHRAGNPAFRDFKKKDAKPEEPAKEEEAAPKKEVVAIESQKDIRARLLKSRPKAIRAAFR